MAKLRPVAWDAPRPDISEEQRKICTEMKKAVRELLTLVESEANCFCKVITSYPHSSLQLAPEAGDGKPIPWQTRSIEVLFQFRRRLAGTPLLTYGPDAHALYLQKTSVPVNIEQAEYQEAQWKARHWRESLRGLADALVRPQKDTPIVLFTGAGASLAEGAYGPGMPPTSWLLEQTCQTVVKGLPDREDPEGDSKGCWHEGKEAKPAEPKPYLGAVTPIDWLIEYLLADRKHRAAQLQCLLETIFSKKENKASARGGSAERFYACFRDILQRFDHGFPYHHWLLAQMPWTRIVTTNFDGFHERAAMVAATTFAPDSEMRLDCLRLGNVFPISALERRDPPFSPEELTGLYKTCRLFKPYGSLLSPVELALGAEALEKFSTRLKPALDVIENAERGWLVVIGHAMRDEYINVVLKEINGKDQKLGRRFELLWIDPDSFRRCTRPAPRGDQRIGFAWERLIEEKRILRDTGEAEVAAARYSGPLPSTALEFSYDLYIEFLDALQRLRPRGGV